MAELETAGVVKLILDECTDPWNPGLDEERCAEIIEADRKAVALRVLDEVAAIDDLGPNPKTGTDYDLADVTELRQAIATLRAKYQEKP